MDVSIILGQLVSKFPIVALVLGILGTLVVVGQTVVVMTPSKKDDEAMDKAMSVPILGAILKAVAAFAPVQKK